MTVTQSSERLTERDIQRYLETGRSEDTTLEFKRAVYERNDEGKKEFVKDVAAFANSQGGHLLIGIIEEEGSASELSPVEDVDLDFEIQRLQNLCTDCLEPNVMGIDIYSIGLDGGAILAVKVPKSWTAPHRAKSKKSKAFYQRHSRSISEMDVSQLREAFTGAATAFDKVASLSRKLNYDVWKKANDAIEKSARDKVMGNKNLLDFDENDPSKKDGILVLHIIPVGNVSERTTFPIEALLENMGLFMPMLGMTFNHMINLQGVRYFDTDGELSFYTQLHRSGALECVVEGLIFQLEGRRALMGPKISNELKEHLPSYLEGLKKLGVTPPLFIKMRILRTTQSTMDSGRDRYGESIRKPVFEESAIELPEVVLLDFPDEPELNSLGKDLLDPLWNAYGKSKCPCFDNNGKWLDCG